LKNSSSLAGGRTTYVSAVKMSGSFNRGLRGLGRFIAESTRDTRYEFEIRFTSDEIRI